MRFYQGLLPAIIWDPKVKAPKVEFKNGIFDTDDEDIIIFLKKEGYLIEEDVKILEAGGNIDHGGFEPQVPVDKDLPSGRAPMDDPDMAPSGIPQKRKMQLDAFPNNEQEDLTKVQGEGLADISPDINASQKRIRRKISRRDKK